MIRISNPHVLWPQHVFSSLRILNQFKDTSEEEEKKRSKTTNGNKCKHGKPTLAMFLGPVLEEMTKALSGTQTEGQEMNVSTMHQEKNKMLSQKQKRNHQRKKRRRIRVLITHKTTLNQKKRRTRRASSVSNSKFLYKTEGWRVKDGG